MERHGTLTHLTGRIPVRRCRDVQGIANTAYLEGFPFPALLRVAPYCVPGGIRVVSGARVLRNSPTRKKISAACLFLPLQGVGYGLLESHRRTFAPRFLPFFFSHACAHSRNSSVSLGEEVRVSWNTFCFVQGLRCTPQPRRPLRFSFCSSHAGK